MADGKITVEVSTQAAQAEMERLRVELAALREKVGLAYGYLWCVNNEPCAPDYMPPDRMAYEARKVLRDTMTHDERGGYINRVLTLVRGVGA